MLQIYTTFKIAIYLPPLINSTDFSDLKYEDDVAKFRVTIAMFLADVLTHVCTNIMLILGSLKVINFHLNEYGAEVEFKKVK